MRFKQLVAPRLNNVTVAGACLVWAQFAYGAPPRYDSAWQAGEATRHKHYNRSIPNGAILWFSHYGTYWKYSKGRYEYDNFGHVVIKWNGKYYGSPASGTGRYVANSIAEVEAVFACQFKFWSEDINGVRALEPIPGSGGSSKPSKPASKETRVVRHYINRDKHAPKGGRVLAKAGSNIHLNTKNDTGSQATNIVGGIGYYSITVHLYAKGTPGESLDVTLLWDNTKAAKRRNSPHYTQRFTFNKDGVINENVEFKRRVDSGFAVYARVASPSTNKNKATVTLFDTDAYLFSS